jgi:hypothetical protein
MPGSGSWRWHDADRGHSSLERLTADEKYPAALPQLKRAA